MNTNTLSIINDLAKQIILFLDFDNTIKLHKALNYSIPDIYIYWKALEFNKTLLHEKFLLEDKFKYSYNNKLKKFYDFIKTNPKICIAGGYPSLMFLGKDLKDYPDSDIDIYVMEKKDSLNETINLLNFLTRTYNVSITDHKHSRSVFNVKVEGCSRVLQVIIISISSIQKILNSFDMGYIKCALYLGHTYTTYDAIYSKNTGVSYTKYPNRVRINKAYDKGIKVHDYEKTEIIKFCKYCTKYETCKKCKYFDTTENLTMKDIISNFIPIDEFIIGYHTLGSFICDDNMDFRKSNPLEVIFTKGKPMPDKLIRLLFLCGKYTLYTPYVQKLPTLIKSFKFNICGILTYNQKYNMYSIKVSYEHIQQFLDLNNFFIKVFKIIDEKYHAKVQFYEIKCRSRIKTSNGKLDGTYFSHTSEDNKPDDYEYIKHHLDKYIYIALARSNDFTKYQKLIDEKCMFELSISFKITEEHNHHTGIQVIVYVDYEISDVQQVLFMKDKYYEEDVEVGDDAVDLSLMNEINDVQDSKLKQYEFEEDEMEDEDEEEEEEAC